jgi:hypothetical protein
MARPRGRPTPKVQAPEVRVRRVRVEPTSLQARYWRWLWEKLLAPEPPSPAQEQVPSPTATHGGAEDGAEDQASHSRSGRPGRADPLPTPHRARKAQRRRPAGRRGPST